MNPPSVGHLSRMPWGTLEITVSASGSVVVTDRFGIELAAGDLLAEAFSWTVPRS